MGRNVWAEQRLNVERYKRNVTYFSENGVLQLLGNRAAPRDVVLYTRWRSSAAD